MSVSTIIEDKRSRASLKTYVRPPKMLERPPPKVKAQSSPQRMGTAVDYAIRFGLEVRGGYPPQHGIVADGALSVVDRHPEYSHHRDAIIDRRLGALIDLCDLHATPDLPRTVASACLRLAGLDTIFRAHRFDDLDWTPDDTAIAELQAIYALLANRFGAYQDRDDEPRPVKIDTLGLYFARVGHLFRFPLDACIDPAHHDTVLDLLIQVGAAQRSDLG